MFFVVLLPDGTEGKERFLRLAGAGLLRLSDFWLGFHDGFPKSVTSSVDYPHWKVAEVAADFMTTFYSVQVAHWRPKSCARRRSHFGSSHFLTRSKVPRASCTLSSFCLTAPLLNPVWRRGCRRYVSRGNRIEIQRKNLRQLALWAKDQNDVNEEQY
jgi:hypothetical protein